MTVSDDHRTIEQVRKRAIDLAFELRLLVDEAYYIGRLDGINLLSKQLAEKVSQPAPTATEPEVSP